MKGTMSDTADGSIEDVLQAMELWTEAKRELTACYADCDSSADYFCHRKAESERQCRDALGEALEKFVDHRIRVLAATGWWEDRQEK